MNYTEAMNIPVTLRGESTVGSLLPALCWRHHTLQAGLITRGSFRRQKRLMEQTFGSSRTDV